VDARVACKIELVFLFVKELHANLSSSEEGPEDLKAAQEKPLRTPRVQFR
jgi:hypothetical protein